MLSVKVLTMFAKIQNLKNKYTLNEAQIRYRSTTYFMKCFLYALFLPLAKINICFACVICLIPIVNAFLGTTA